jgi:short-subunit dehydrogenase
VDNVIAAITSAAAALGSVNNAGFGIHGDFASSDIDRNLELAQVQVTSMRPREPFYQA